MLLKSPGKVLEKSLNKRLSNLYEPCNINRALINAVVFVDLNKAFNTVNNEHKPA